MTEEKRDRRFTRQLCGLLAVLRDTGDIDVGNEIIGVGALEYEHLDGVVGLSLVDERNQIADQFRPQKVHRRRGNFHEQDGSFREDCESFERQISLRLAISEHVLQVCWRKDLNAARTSAEKSSGCSQAAKCPPLSTAWK